MQFDNVIIGWASVSQHQMERPTITRQEMHLRIASDKRRFLTLLFMRRSQQTIGWAPKRGNPNCLALLLIPFHLHLLYLLLLLLVFCWTKGS